MVIEYILAVMFLADPGRPPQLVAPMEDKVSCFKAAGQLAIQSKDELEAHKAVPVCLKIEFPSV